MPGTLGYDMMGVLGKYDVLFDIVDRFWCNHNAFLKINKNAYELISTLNSKRTNKIYTCIDKYIILGRSLKPVNHILFFCKPVGK